MNKKKISVDPEVAAKCSPVAYDPLLQDKINELTSNPNLYYLKNELWNQKESLEYLLRQERALNKEIGRAKATVEALRIAVKALAKEMGVKDPEAYCDE